MRIHTRALQIDLCTYVAHLYIIFERLTDHDTDVVHGRIELGMSWKVTISFSIGIVAHLFTGQELGTGHLVQMAGAKATVESPNTHGMSISFWNRILLGFGRSTERPKV
jgi:hypothetical protein